jgi:hypothetical protein
MDGWLLASPYGSYGSLAVPYREASGSYGRRDINLRPSTVTARRAALNPPISEFSGERMNGMLQNISTNRRLRTFR